MQITSLQNENSILKEDKAKYHQQILFNQRKAERGENFKILDSKTIQNLRIIRKIGSNTHEKVFEVGIEENYVLKEMNIEDCSIRKHRHFIGEYEKMCRLYHPNIIKTYGIYLSDEKNPPSILLEYCPKNIQQEVNDSNLSNIEIPKILYQIAEGMKYIHKNKLIHLNLKPSNILIGKDGLIRISDFFISKIVSLGDSYSSSFGKGEEKFMAPELLNDEKYDEKVDVYSFGVLMFFILSGGKFPETTIIQVGNGIKAKIPDEFTDFAKSLINNCWNFDATQRPSFENICEEFKENISDVVELTEIEVKDVHLFLKSYKMKIEFL